MDINNMIPARLGQVLLSHGIYINRETSIQPLQKSILNDEMRSDGK